jgi:hypothetical protein
MATRKLKPKPAYSPLIEWPTEQLQLVPITVERKTPASGGQLWQVQTELPVARSSRRRSKITLH